jgi:hypothetical protein
MLLLVVIGVWIVVALFVLAMARMAALGDRVEVLSEPEPAPAPRQLAA